MNKNNYNSLDKTLSGKSISVVQVLTIACGIIEELEKIHALPAIHGDVNPSTIAYDEKNRCVALSKPDQGYRLQGIEVTLDINHIPYISPEQTGRMNRQIDYRTDYYSLGIILYKLLTGSAPFISTDPLEMIHAHLAIVPTSPHTIAPSIPLMLSAIVMKLLAKNAEDRYQSTGGLLFDLHECKNILMGGACNDDLQLGAKDFTGRLQVPQKLYGRDQEINQLMKVFDKISQGGTELLLVSGYSGVGKSALIREVHKPITARHGFFIEGKFEQYQRNIPYFAWARSFSGLINQLLMTDTTQLKAWREKILTAVGNNGKVLTDVIGNLEQVIGVQRDVPELGGVEAQIRFNNVFQSFVKIISQAEHPLVIFLDDLQWMDSASLNLLNTLMTDPDLTHCLIIAVYRDNEVDATHPLMLSLAELQKAEVNIGRIVLKNLSKTDVNDLVSDTLHCTGETSEPISKLIFAKTAGNAFFTHQILYTLEEDALLTFDSNTYCWQWDMSVLKSMDITDNVVELMLNKVRRLPTYAQEMLKFSASIGSQFDINRLHIISQESEDTIQKTLEVALQQGIIQPFNNRYKFSHDRIQQAAYSLLPKSEVCQHHLNIARLLAAQTSNKDLFCFEVADHFNMGFSLITDTHELALVSKLNFEAGHKAKKSTAYPDALNYMKKAYQLLDHANYTQDEREVLYRDLIELEYLNGSFDKPVFLADEYFKSTTVILEKIDIYKLLMQVLTVQVKMDQVLSIGSEALSQLGIEICEQEPTELNIDKFYDLPEMTDPAKLAGLAVLSQMWAAAYTADPTLMRKIVYTMVFLCYHFGNSSFASIAYVFFANQLNSDLKLAEAYRFGRLSLDILNKYPAPELTAKVMCIFHVTVQHNTDYIRVANKAARLGIQPGIDVGDLQWASYTSVHTANHCFIIGDPLPDAIEIIEREVLQAHSRGLDYHEILGRIWLQGCETMANETLIKDDNKAIFTGKWFSEQELTELVKANAGTLIFAAYTCKAMCHFLLNDHTKSLEASQAAIPYIDAGSGLYYVYIHNFYYSLALLSCYGTAQPEEQKTILTTIVSNQQAMKLWAGSSPKNFQNKYDLIEAQRSYLVDKDFDKAALLFEQSIQQSARSDFPHEEALACELAAGFYRMQELKRMEQLYLSEAYRLYKKWGGEAKNAEMKQQYPQLFAPRSNEGAKTETPLDINSVIKASQAITSEIVTEKLLAKLMKIVIESVGAQRGSLLFDQNGKWVVEEQTDINHPEVQGKQSVDTDENESICNAIVNYVAQTQANLVLDDACNEGDFTLDAYILSNKVKSVICLPLFNKGQLSSVLYLENNLTTCAFSAQRIQLLEILCSQAAISLENAGIYQNLEKRVEQRTIELKDAKESAEGANRAKSDFIANMSHEIRTPMNAVLGFAEVLQGLEDDPKKSRYLKNIKTSGHTLLNLINDILDLAKIEAGKLELNYKVVSMAELCQDMQTVFEQKVIDIGLDFIVDISEDIPLLVLDESRLRQVLINLIGNATKFTKQGHIRLAVYLTSPKARSDAMVDLTIEVEDTGIGIPEDQHDKIFGTFEQTAGQKTDEYGGTGLGLSITRSLIQMMEGETSVISAPDQGATFRILLKAIEVASFDDLKENQEQQLNYQAIMFKPATILIADDIDYNREMICAYLEAWDFKLIEAENGEQALEQARLHKPDLILTDMKMPVMDGYEASKILKADKVLQHIPIIAITASALLQDEDKILKVCDGYLRKPLAKPDLVTEMMKYLPHGERVEERTKVEEISKDKTMAMAIPSREELEKLYHFAMTGIMDDISKYALLLEEQNKAYRPFSKKLQTLADSFKDKEVLSFIEGYLNND